MSEHKVHEAHNHLHGPGCGHKAITHDSHTDYVHDGHLHTPHGTHVDECVIAADAVNPSVCTPSHRCEGHALGHAHGEGCGHTAIPHGDHLDFLVVGHLHHPHGSHCDDHGPIHAA